eukprot:scaffold32210_cov19-Tisochrysis_lutea.AAC.1
MAILRFIESSKSRPSGSPQAQQSLAVAVYVFDRVLKLMHPFMPYVTEELWQALPHKGDSAGEGCGQFPITVHTKRYQHGTLSNGNTPGNEIGPCYVG